jgi:hypothetical protein
MESGTNSSGFRGLGLHDFKIQTPHTTTPKLQKVKGMWDQHFGVLGFGTSEFTNTCRTNKVKMSNLLNEIRVWAQ